MKKIYISEDKLRVLMNEMNEEVTFYEFFVNAKSFLKDLLTKPYEAEPSGLFKKKGISKDELVKKMKDIGLLKSDERIDEVPIDEGKKVAKHFIKYMIPKNRFEDKMKELYRDMFNESYVLKETDKIIHKILDMDYDGAYRNRGGYEKDIVSEDGAAAAGGGATSCGNVMQGGGGNPDAGQFITPMSPIQRRKFYSDTLKRR